MDTRLIILILVIVVGVGGNATQIAEDRGGLRLDGDAGGRIRTSASGGIAPSRYRKLVIHFYFPVLLFQWPKSLERSFRLVHGCLRKNLK